MGGKFKVSEMKDHKYHNNLEQFLQSQAEKHKLFPDDKIWRNIYQEIHDKKHWYALPIVSLFIIAALTVSTIIYENPIKNNFTTTNHLLNAVTTNNNNIQQNLAQNLAPINSYPIHQPKQTTKIHLINQHQQEKNLPTNNIVTQTVVTEKISANITEQTNNELNNQANLIPLSNQVYATNSLPKNIQATANQSIIKQTNKSLVKNNDLKTIQSLYSNVDVINKNVSTKKILNPSKFELQVYATPSISFRRLADDKTRNAISLRDNNDNGPISSQFLLDVNDVVRHKPALGLEAGVGVLYKLTDNVKLRFGLQFNMRKYYIDSYKSGVNVAQIAVVTNNGIDTITQLSTTSNTSGYSSTTLKNKLYQASVPIGIQWQLLQKNKFGISIGASIQPTLTLNKNVYLISTDYKFYTDGTSFFRKWNINTDLDINFTYKLGNYHFFISPQIRYQHLPTYVDEYPIKEYRLDNGLRIGFIKQIFK